MPVPSSLRALARLPKAALYITTIIYYTVIIAYHRSWEFERQVSTTTQRDSHPSPASCEEMLTKERARDFPGCDLKQKICNESHKVSSRERVPSGSPDVRKLTKVLLSILQPLGLPWRRVLWIFSMASMNFTSTRKLTSPSDTQFRKQGTS